MMIDDAGEIPNSKHQIPRKSETRNTKSETNSKSEIRNSKSGYFLAEMTSIAGECGKQR
jgi:hypothetical protein